MNEESLKGTWRQARGMVNKHGLDPAGGLSNTNTTERGGR